MSPVIDAYLADGLDLDAPWTEDDVIECAVAHSTRVAATHSGWSITRVRNARSRRGHNRGRGHPSTAELEREEPRVACPCRRCAAWRSGEATRSSIRHARTQPKGFPKLGAWVELAACADVDHQPFFPRRPNGPGYADPPDTFGSRQRAIAGYRAETYAAAKAICARCPVIDQCRAYSLENGVRFGVWGGLDWLERDRLLGHLPAGVA